MATCSSTLAWRIPWTGEPGGLQSMGSQRVGHNRVSTHTEYMHLISRQTALKCDHTISFFLKQPSSFLGMLPSFMEPQEKRRFGSKYYFGKGICSRCCGHLTHVPSLSTSVNARANSPLPRPALFFAWEHSLTARHNIVVGGSQSQLEQTGKFTSLGEASTKGAGVSIPQAG